MFATISNSVHGAIDYAATEGAIFAADYIAPSIDWSPSPNLQSGARTLAFYLAVAWIIMLLVQVAVPKRRMGMGGQGVMRYIGPLILIFLMLDLNIIPKIVNWILEAIWWIGDLIGFVS